MIGPIHYVTVFASFSNHDSTMSTIVDIGATINTYLTEGRGVGAVGYLLRGNFALEVLCEACFEVCKRRSAL